MGQGAEDYAPLERLPRRIVKASELKEGDVFIEKGKAVNYGAHPFRWLEANQVYPKMFGRMRVLKLDARSAMRLQHLDTLVTLSQRMKFSVSMNALQEELIQYMERLVKEAEEFYGQKLSNGEEI